MDFPLHTGILAYSTQYAWLGSSSTIAVFVFVTKRNLGFQNLPSIGIMHAVVMHGVTNGDEAFVEW